MDLQPLPSPPPPPPFRHHHHRHHYLRYENSRHPPDVAPIPYDTHLPPPHFRPPNFYPPPPSSPPPLPLPPVRYTAHRGHSPPFNFPPPRGPIHGRSDLYEFDPPPKPYFNSDEYLPSHRPREPDPPRFIRDYPEGNPIIKDEGLARGFYGDYLREVPGHSGRDLRWGARDLPCGVPDVGDRERFRDSNYQSREMNNWREDDVRRWDGGIDDWDRDLYIKRDYDGRRWDWDVSGRIHAFGSERDYDDRRLNIGIFDHGRGMNNERDRDERKRGNDVSNWGHSPVNERVYYEKKWNDDIIDQDHSRLNGRDYHERRWNYGIRNRGHELYCEGNVDDGRLNYVYGDGVPLQQLKDRQPEFLKDDFSSSRFNERLERGASQGDISRSKKRKLQKKTAPHRIQPVKSCSWHSRGYKCQHLSRKPSNHSFRGKEKEGPEQLQTRVEDKEEEQSAVDLDISFKSNSLIGKAIMAPSCPVKSNLKNVNDEKVDGMSQSSFSRSDVDTVKEDDSMCDLDLSDPQVVSDERLDNVVVSGGRSTPAYEADDLSEISVKNEDLEGKKLLVPNTIEAGSVEKMRNFGKPNVDENNLQMTGNINLNDCGGHQSAVPWLNSDATLSKEITLSKSIGVVSDTVSLSSLGGIISREAEMDGDSCKPAVSNFKRQRSSLTTYPASSHMVDNLVGAIETFSQCSRFCTDGVDDCCEHSSKDGLVSFEKDFVMEHSVFEDSIEGHGIYGLTKTEEFKIPERHEDQHHLENHEPTSSETDNLLLQNPENVTMFGKGTTYVIPKEMSPVQANTAQVGVDAVKEFSSLDDAGGGDSSNVSLGISLSSNFLTVGHEGNSAQFYVSSIDAIRKKSFSEAANQSHSIGSVEGSDEAISHVTSLSSPRITGKRKTMDISDAKPEVVIDTFGSMSCEVECSTKDLVSVMEVDFLDGNDYSKKDSSFYNIPSGIEDATPEGNSFHGLRKLRKVASPRSKLSSLSDDDAVANGFVGDSSIHGQESKKLNEWRAEQSGGTLTASGATKECSPGDVEAKAGSENLTVADSDDALADGHELEVDDELVIIVDNPSSSADRNSFFASNSGNELLTSGFGMRSCMSSPEEMPSYSDVRFSRNRELLSSHKPVNKMSWSRDDASRRKPMPVAPNTISFGKSLDKASSYLPTNTQSASLLPVGRGKVVEKFNPLPGKLISSKNQLTCTVPRVIPGHQPISSRNSRLFNSTHATKSRTWHRTNNPIAAVSEARPKPKPAPPPQSHGTKPTKPIHSSYIRKGNSLVRKDSPSSVTKSGFHVPSSSVYRMTPCTENVLVRKDSPSSVTKSGFHVPSSSVYRMTPCTENVMIAQASNSKIADTNASTQLRTVPVNMSVTPEELPLKHDCKSLNCIPGNLGESLLAADVPRNTSPNTLGSLEETVKLSPITECQTGSVINTDSQSTLEEESLRKKITYVKRRSNQLVASSSSDDLSKLGGDISQAPSSSNGYFKSKKYQLVRASSEDHDKKGDANVNSHSVDSQTIFRRTSSRRQSGFAKGYRSSKFSHVWKLHDTLPSEKRKKVLGPRKMWPQFAWKKATQGRSFIHVLGTKLNGSSIPTASQKILLSRRRGAIYRRSTHGYSLKISKVLSVGGSSLKWSKSIERNSKKANEEATRAVAAAEKRKKGDGAVPVASKSRNHVSRKLVLSVKLQPGERIFRIGLERYRMDPTRRTLHRIMDENEVSSATVQCEKNAKRSYVPRRLLIGNDQYVRIGNGNQLVRDPKKRTRMLASERVRWSLRTARLRLARKRKYCQFFTRFGKCNKDDGKCPYVHDPSKIAVCTKFLSGSCSNVDCKLTHKIIPERMQDCSYFLKGSCCNENCPYRHVNVNPDSAVCESFLRGYCADGNECLKKHTYVCPVYETTGTCPQESTCKLHHPKKKTEKKPINEQKIVRGRYFDGGLEPINEQKIVRGRYFDGGLEPINEQKIVRGRYFDGGLEHINEQTVVRGQYHDGGLVTDCSIAETAKLSTKDKDDILCHDGKFPDYISLEVSDDEMDCSSPKQGDNTQPDTQMAEFNELIKPFLIRNQDSLICLLSDSDQEEASAYQGRECIAD